MERDNAARNREETDIQDPTAINGDDPSLIAGIEQLAQEAEEAEEVVENTREGKIRAVTEENAHLEASALTLKDALREVENIKEGDMKGLTALATKLSKERLIKMLSIKGGGWNCELRMKDEGPLTEKDSGDLADAINDKRAKMIAEKQPRKSPIEITLETVNDIDSLRGLEVLAYTCHRKGLLIKRDTTEVKWHVEAIDGVEGSEKLVKAIMRKHRELLNKLYAGIELKNEALRRINAVSDADELNKLAWKCHQKGLVKKIITGERENDWKVEEIEGVVGSKNIAEAIMAKKKEFGELEEDREFASDLADISNRYGKKNNRKG